jgi:hypothetical protein
MTHDESEQVAERLVSNWQLDLHALQVYIQSWKGHRRLGEHQIEARDVHFRPRDCGIGTLLLGTIHSSPIAARKKQKGEFLPRTRLILRTPFPVRKSPPFHEDQRQRYPIYRTEDIFGLLDTEAEGEVFCAWKNSVLSSWRVPVSKREEEEEEVEEEEAAVLRPL